MGVKFLGRNAKAYFLDFLPTGLQGSRDRDDVLKDRKGLPVALREVPSPVIATAFEDRLAQLPVHLVEPGEQVTHDHVVLHGDPVVVGQVYDLGFLVVGFLRAVDEDVGWDPESLFSCLQKLGYGISRNPRQQKQEDS